jgi:hypothetical protein
MWFRRMTTPQNGQQYTELHEFSRDNGKVSGTLGQNITAHIARNQEILSRHSSSANT